MYGLMGSGGVGLGGGKRSRGFGLAGTSSSISSSKVLNICERKGQIV